MNYLNQIVRHIFLELPIWVRATSTVVITLERYSGSYVAPADVARQGVTPFLTHTRTS
jgi:hypothetical protein